VTGLDDVELGSWDAERLFQLDEVPFLIVIAEDLHHV